MYNIFATFSMECPVQPLIIAKSMRNTKYTSNQPCICRVMLKKPHVAAKIHSKGKVWLKGKALSDIYFGGRRIARIIQKLGYDVKIKWLKVKRLEAQGKSSDETNLKLLSSLRFSKGLVNVSFDDGKAASELDDKPGNSYIKTITSTENSELEKKRNPSSLLAPIIITTEKTRTHTTVDAEKSLKMEWEDFEAMQITNQSDNPL